MDEQEELSATKIMEAAGLSFDDMIITEVRYTDDELRYLYDYYTEALGNA